MAENENTENTATEADPESGSALRKQLESVLAENKKLKSERRQRAYTDAGIPEGAYDVFDQMYDGELTPEALRGFASSKGFQLGDGTVAPDPAQQRSEGEERLSQVQSAALPSRDPSIKDQIAEAEANGDWTRVDRLNAELLEQQRRSA